MIMFKSPLFWVYLTAILLVCEAIALAPFLYIMNYKFDSDHFKKYELLSGFWAAGAVLSSIAFLLWLTLGSNPQKTTYKPSEHIIKNKIECTAYKIKNKKIGCFTDAYVYLNAANDDSLSLNYVREYNKLGFATRDWYELESKETGKYYKIGIEHEIKR